MSKQLGTYYWQMQFYFLMAVATVCASIYFLDFSWLLLAFGSSCLGISNRMCYVAQNSKQAEPDKASVISRIGFLIIASALLVNALGVSAGV